MDDPEDTTHPSKDGASSGVRHPECARHEVECDARWTEVERSIKSLEAAVVEHKLRLENGSRVFADIKTEIAAVRSDVKEVAKTITPKPVDWFRIVTWAVTALAMVLTAWWALSEKFSDRPTHIQVQEVIKTHADLGHPALNAEIQKIRDEQTEQRTDLRVIKQQTEATRVDMADVKADLRALRYPRGVPTSPQPAPTP